MHKEYEKINTYYWGYTIRYKIFGHVDLTAAFKVVELFNLIRQFERISILEI